MQTKTAMRGRASDTGALRCPGLGDGVRSCCESRISRRNEWFVLVYTHLYNQAQHANDIRERMSTSSFGNILDA